MMGKRIALLIVLLMVTTGVVAQESQDSRLLAISTIPPLEPTPTIQGFIAAMDLVSEAGVTAGVITESWSALEPAAGEYALEDLFNNLNFAGGTHDQVLYLGIQVLNTTTKETPADLLEVPFDAPEMIERFNQLMTAIVERMHPNVRYISIGNEVDAYLSAHPGAWTSYTTFYEAVVSYWRERLPGIQFGVTGTWQGSLAHRADILRLNALSDVFILTYYPLNPDFTPTTPDAPLTDFPVMLDLAAEAGLPLILQEVGYPAAEELGSSEAEQAAFVEQVYAAWAEAGASIPLLNFFLLHDFSDALTEGFMEYYNLPGFDNFYWFLRSLGLRQVDGTPRLGWDAFVKGSATVQRS
jgi:hypothetical protein